jgi:hypothetical protein
VNTDVTGTRECTGTTDDVLLTTEWSNVSLCADMVGTTLVFGDTAVCGTCELVTGTDESTVATVDWDTEACATVGNIAPILRCPLGALDSGVLCCLAALGCELVALGVPGMSVSNDPVDLLRV